MISVIIPNGYQPVLTLRETEIAIKAIKDFFEKRLAEEMNLTRVSAPIFLKKSTGMNDNLNGIENPVTFEIKEQKGDVIEIVQSLAKWKRYALKKYEFRIGEGIYADMNAIRRDEVTDNIHSVYVDQWDWEKIIKKKERNISVLNENVKKIYNAIKDTERVISETYNYVQAILPDDIYFITSQELEDLYPEKIPKEREKLIAKEKGAVFISKIGKTLKSGEKHDGRAPDYDDWELNGDIIVYYPILDIGLELSSMGIRVDEETLVKQLCITGNSERLNFPFQKMLIEGNLPYTIGGGIGQSRICMFCLRKVHIGEVQASLWPDNVYGIAEGNALPLL